jgi:hypothetical protein
MMLFINIAILCMGSVGGLTAIFGSTVVDRQPPPGKRITKTGWIAILSLLGTLVLGIHKEELTHRVEAEYAHKLEEATKTITDLRNEVFNLQILVSNRIPDPGELEKDAQKIILDTLPELRQWGPSHVRDLKLGLNNASPYIEIIDYLKKTDKQAQLKADILARYTRAKTDDFAKAHL